MPWLMIWYDTIINMLLMLATKHQVKKFRSCVGPYSAHLVLYRAYECFHSLYTKIQYCLTEKKFYFFVYRPQNHRYKYLLDKIQYTHFDSEMIFQFNPSHSTDVTKSMVEYLDKASSWDLVSEMRTIRGKCMYIQFRGWIWKRSKRQTRQLYCSNLA